MTKPESPLVLAPRHGRDRISNCIARWKIGNIGNIVVHQQLNRQQIGNRPATSVTSLLINNLTKDLPSKTTTERLHPVNPVYPVLLRSVFDIIWHPWPV